MHSIGNIANTIVITVYCDQFVMYINSNHYVVCLKLITVCQLSFSEIIMKIAKVDKSVVKLEPLNIVDGNVK